MRSVKSIMNRVRVFKLETFRFEDEYDYVYEILSVLISGARTWARWASFWREHVKVIVILLRITENVVAEEKNYKEFEVLSFCGREMALNLLQ